MSIYVKSEKEIKSIQDVVDAMFSEPRIGAIGAKGTETYSDPEFNIIQCKAGKYRSFDDVMEACKTYFPETTIQEVYHAITKPRRYKYFKKYLFLYCVYCEDIKKPTMIYWHSPALCLKTAKEGSELSWYDINTTCGVHNEKDFYKALRIKSVKTEKFNLIYEVEDDE